MSKNVLKYLTCFPESKLSILSKLINAYNNANNLFILSLCQYYTIISLPVQVVGFEPSIIGLLVKCSTTVLVSLGD
jgi:hypothetical protein